MALRSHRLCCHRSICRGVLLVSSLISLFSPLLSPLLPLLSFIVSLSLYLAHTHTKILSACTLSPYGSRTLPFIHNTHGTKSWAPRTPAREERSDSPSQNVALDRPFYGRKIFKNKSCNEKERLFVLDRRMAHFIMLENERSKCCGREKKQRKREWERKNDSKSEGW